MTLEVRSTVGPGDIDATDEGIIFGLAIPYNRQTVIGDMSQGGFRENIAPGSCSKSLREADIVALFNHNSGQPLGRTSAGQLTLKNTTRGIEPELTPVDTSYAKDLATLVKNKVIRGWSFGFECIKDDWTDDDGNLSDQWSGTNRTIREMKLVEVSPVTFPAYEMTSISSRDAVSAAREGRGEKRGDERGGNAPGDGSKPYGDVQYADNGLQADGKKRYPLDSPAHAKAAWSYINQKANQAAYTATQLATVMGNIKAACKKYGITITDENAQQLANEWRAEARATKKAEKRAKRAKRNGKSDGLSDGTSKRIPQIAAALSQALSLFASADAKDLTADVQAAIALVSSAATHASHIQDHEGLEPLDAISDSDAKGRAGEPPAEERGELKPDESTSADLPDDEALSAMYYSARSRQISMGI